MATKQTGKVADGTSLSLHTRDGHEVTLKLKRKASTDEWVVVWMEDGKRVEARCYYTDDKADAIYTMRHMHQQHHVELSDWEDRYAVQGPDGDTVVLVNATTMHNAWDKWETYWNAAHPEAPVTRDDWHGGDWTVWRVQSLHV